MYKPIKMPRGKRYGNNFWDCYSNKINRDVSFYSELEYEHWLLIETNPDIIDFCEQPFVIIEEFEGRYHKSIPDMWIKWQDGTEEIREVKYSKDLNVELCSSDKKYKKTQKQLAIQRNWCNKNNFIYRVITDKEIRQEPRLYNSRVIKPYLNSDQYYNEINMHKILNVIPNQACKISDIYALIDIDINNINEAIILLYFQKKILIDLSAQKFTPNSIVRRKYI